MPAGMAGYGAGSVDVPATSATMAGVRNLSTENGGVTWQQSHSNDPSQELEVLKNILLREGYLERLRVMVGLPRDALAPHPVNGSASDRSGGGRAPPLAVAVREEMVDLLDLVRLATTETTEAIVRWRRTLLRPAPFVWNGVNYLLKMPCDLDFLAAVRPLRDWLGFDIRRNPFVVPCQLDERPDTPPGGAADSVHAASNPGGQTFSTDDGAWLGASFHSIGGGSGGAQPPPSAFAGRAAMGSAQGGSGAPYGTPVLNDRTMVPPTEQSLPQARRGGGRVLPSHIGDLDMLRVREAEKVLLQEEELHGRYVRDAAGRLVPQLMMTHANLRDGKRLDSDVKPLPPFARHLGPAGAAASSSPSHSPNRSARDRDRAAAAASGGGGAVPRGGSGGGGGGGGGGERERRRRARAARATAATGAAAAEHSASAGAGGYGSGGGGGAERAGDGRSVSFAAHESGGLGELSPRSGDGQWEAEAAAAGGEAAFGSEEWALSANANAPRGAVRALKQGGLLPPMDKADTAGVMSEPERLATTSAMDHEIKRAIAENDRLEEELDELRAELAAAEAEVWELENEEKGQAAATLIQATFRGQQGRRAFARKRHRLERRRAEVVSRQLELSRRREEVAKKERARKEFQLKFMAEQEKRRAALLARKKAEMDAAAEEAARARLAAQLAGMGVEERASVTIQRVARGMIDRHLVRDMRQDYTAAAIRLQGLARGKAARKRVSRARAERDASTLIQRVARGAAARRRVAGLRNTAERRMSCITIQRVGRGMLGRRRMRVKQQVARLAEEVETLLLALPSEAFMRIADEYAYSTPPLLAMTLLQCIVTLTASGSGRPRGGWHMSWARLRRRITHPLFWPRLQRLEQHCLDEVLELPAARVEVVSLAFHDPDMAPASLLKLLPPSIARPCHDLFLFLRSAIEIDRLLLREQFAVVGGGRGSRAVTDGWSLAEEAAAESDDDDGEPSLDDSSMRGPSLRAATDLKNPHLYIPPSVLRSGMVRPRPVLLVVARDVPAHGKRLLIDRLTDTLPAMFSHMDTSKLDIRTLQSALDTGHSVIAHADIGMGANRRRAFLARMRSVKHALEPTPLCMLLRGDPKNRVEGGNPRVGVGSHSLDAMADGLMKMCLERAAAAVHPLSSSSGCKALSRLGSGARPCFSAVLVLEAVMVLLTPEQSYDGPSSTVGAVSWQSAAKLLAAPERLVSSLRLLNVAAVPAGNLTALQQYVAHPGWPSARAAAQRRAASRMATAAAAAGAPPRQQQQRQRVVRFGRRQDGDAARPEYVDPSVPVPVTPELEVVEGEGEVPPVIFPLARWVKLCVKYATMLAKEGGVPPDPARDGVFTGVIMMRDDAAEEYGGAGSGWNAAFNHALASVLRDVRVFSEGRRVSGRNMVVSVYRDKQAIFVGGYQPDRSVQRFARIHQNEVNLLLAPNSLQAGRAKPAPGTPDEMYQRLVSLLKLEYPAGLAPADRKLAGNLGLVLRRPLIRVTRESRRVESIYATLTASEKAPGEVVIQGYVPADSSTHTLLVTRETVRGLIDDTAPVERRALESGQSRRMVPPLLDRLEFKRMHGSNNTSKLTMRLRPRGGSGRLALSTGVRLSNVYFIIKVFALHSSLGGWLRVEAYCPANSERQGMALSLRERVELLGSSGWGHRASWCAALLSRISLESTSRVTRRRKSKDLAVSMEKERKLREEVRQGLRAGWNGASPAATASADGKEKAGEEGAAEGTTEGAANPSSSTAVQHQNGSAPAAAAAAERVEVKPTAAGTEPRSRPVSAKVRRQSLHVSRFVLLDRSLFKRGMKINGVYLTLSFSVPGPSGGLCLVAYDPAAAEEFVVALTDFQVQSMMYRHLGDETYTDPSEVGLPDAYPVATEQQRKAVFSRLLLHLHWRNKGGSRMLALGTPPLAVGVGRTRQTLKQMALALTPAAAAIASNSRRPSWTPSPDADARALDQLGVAMCQLEGIGSALATPFCAVDKPQIMSGAAPPPAVVAAAASADLLLPTAAQAAAIQDNEKAAEEAAAKGVAVAATPPSVSPKPSTSDSAVESAEPLPLASTTALPVPQPLPASLHAASQPLEEPKQPVEGAYTVAVKSLGFFVLAGAYLVMPPSAAPAISAGRERHYRNRAGVGTGVKVSDLPVPNNAVVVTRKTGSWKLSGGESLWIHAYSPELCCSNSVTLLARELPRALGRRGRLALGPMWDMVDYLIKRRLLFQTNKEKAEADARARMRAVADYTPGFTMWFDKAGVYQRDKATPLNKMGEEDQRANANPNYVFTEAGTAKLIARGDPSDVGRGAKVLNTALKLPLSVPLVARKSDVRPPRLLFTVFAVGGGGPGEEVREGYDAKHLIPGVPQVRIVGYAPASSQQNVIFLNPRRVLRMTNAEPGKGLLAVENRAHMGHVLLRMLCASFTWKGMRQGDAERAGINTARAYPEVEVLPFNPATRAGWSLALGTRIASRVVAVRGKPYVVAVRVAGTVNPLALDTSEASALYRPPGADEGTQLADEEEEAAEVATAASSDDGKEEGSSPSSARAVVAGDDEAESESGGDGRVARRRQRRQGGHIVEHEQSMTLSELEAAMLSDRDLYLCCYDPSSSRTQVLPVPKETVAAVLGCPFGELVSMSDAEKQQQASELRAVEAEREEARVALEEQSKAGTRPNVLMGMTEVEADADWGDEVVEVKQEKSAATLTDFHRLRMTRVHLAALHLCKLLTARDVAIYAGTALDDSQAQDEEGLQSLLPAVAEQVKAAEAAGAEQFAAAVERPVVGHRTFLRFKPNKLPTYTVLMQRRTERLAAAAPQHAVARPVTPPIVGTRLYAESLPVSGLDTVVDVYGVSAEESPDGVPGLRFDALVPELGMGASLMVPAQGGTSMLAVLADANPAMAKARAQVFSRMVRLLTMSREGDTLTLWMQGTGEEDTLANKETSEERAARKQQRREERKRRKEERRQRRAARAAAAAEGGLPIITDESDAHGSKSEAAFYTTATSLSDAAPSGGETSAAEHDPPSNTAVSTVAQAAVSTFAVGAHFPTPKQQGLTVPRLASIEQVSQSDSVVPESVQTGSIVARCGRCVNSRLLLMSATALQSKNGPPAVCVAGQDPDPDSLTLRISILCCTTGRTAIYDCSWRSLVVQRNAYQLDVRRAALRLLHRAWVQETPNGSLRLLPTTRDPYYT